MKTNQLLAACCCLLAIASCKKEAVSVNKSKGTASIAYNFNTDASGLKSHMELSNIGVLELKNASLSNLGKVVFNPYPMSVVGTVSAPNAGLTASDVELNNIAYVSYRDVDKNYAGAVDLINISNPYNPSLVAEATFPNTDIYSVKKIVDKLLITGATDISVNRDLQTGAIFAYYSIDGLGMPTTGVLNAFSVKGDIAFDADVRQNKAYIVTGPAQFSGNNDSWLVVFDLTTNTVDTSLPLLDARSVAINGDELTILSGGSVNSYNINTFVKTKSVSNNDFPFFTRKVAYDGNNLVVAAGKEGLKYYDEQRNLLDHLTVPNVVPYTVPTDLACFSVSVDQNNVVMGAMGAAGLYVGLEDTSNQISLLGYVELNAAVVNAVAQNGNYAIAATNEGVKIIQLFTNAATTGWCGYNFIKGVSDIKANFVLINDTVSYGGPAGFQTLVVANKGLYNHCGSIASAKNLAIVDTGRLNITGNIIQGFSNSIYYFSVTKDSKITVDGDVTIYGDLMLEGNINFVGNNHSLRVYGNIFKGPYGSISGSYTDVFGKMPLINTAKIEIGNLYTYPYTSHGVYINRTSENAGTMLSFTPIFPRNVNILDTMYFNEGGSQSLRILYATEYTNSSFNYTKKNGSVVYGVFKKMIYSF